MIVGESVGLIVEGIKIGNSEDVGVTQEEGASVTIGAGDGFHFRLGAAEVVLADGENVDEGLGVRWLVGSAWVGATLMGAIDGVGDAEGLDHQLCEICLPRSFFPLP